MNKNNKILNKFNTIRWKAVFAAIAGAMFIIGCVIIAQKYIVLDKVSDYGKLKGNTAADNYAYDFEYDLTLATSRLNAETKALTEQTNILRIQTAPMAAKMMQYFLETEPMAKSVWLITEPYTLNNSDSLLVNTNPGFPLGWYGRFNKRESGAAEFSNDLMSTPTEIYDIYRQMKRTLQPYTTSLASDGETNESLVLMKPIIINGKFLGVLGLDLDMKILRKKLDAKVPSEIEMIMASQNGNIFYSRKKNLQGRNIREVFRFTEEKIGIISKTIANLPIDDEITLIEQNNLQVYIHNHRIKLPGFDECIIMATFIPLKYIETERHEISTKLVLVALLILTIYIIFIILVSNYLAKPIDTLKDMMRSLAKGDFNIDIKKQLRGLGASEFTSLLHSITNLTNSLTQTAKFATQIKDGNLDAEYKTTLKNNVIGKALVNMRDNLKENKRKEEERLSEEKRNQWATEGHSKFSDILRTHISDIHKLSNEVIDHLVPYINVNQGGMFIRTQNPNDPKTEVLELYGVFAYGHERFHKRIIGMDEGLIGACAMEKHTIILNNVPDDYADISSGLGQAKPKAVMFVPLVFNDYLYGVMEFASFRTFEKYQISFVERISENVASTIANAKINQQTSMLLEQSREQSKMMEQRENELKEEIGSLQKYLETLQTEHLQMEKINHALNRTIMMAQFTLKGETIDANRKFSLRYTLDINDIKRKNIYEILQLTLGKYDDFKKIWDNVKQGATENYVAEFKINNTIRKVRNMLVPVYDSNNKPDKILVLAFDVTNQIAQEDELEKTKKLYAKNNAEIAECKEKIKQYENDIEQLNKELMDAKKQNAETRQRFDKATTSAQFFKRELEKRISKFRKIESNLKEKVKNLENQLNGTDKQTDENDNSKN